MVLSTLAAEFARQIRAHPWADLPGIDGLPGLTYADYAGQGGDPENIRLNVMWVTAKVLRDNDPNFDVVEFAHACGVTGRSRKFLESGLRPHPQAD